VFAELFLYTSAWKSGLLAQYVFTFPHGFQVVMNGCQMQRKFDYYVMDSTHTLQQASLIFVQIITFIDCIFHENVGTALLAFDSTFPV